MLPPNYIMFCVQIHALGTLPSYVHMLLMNSSFYPPCNLWNLICLFLCLATYSFPFEEMFSSGMHFVHPALGHKFQCEATFTVPSSAVTGCVFVTACFI